MGWLRMSGSEPSFWDAVDAIREQDPRHGREAYGFVMAALGWSVTRLPEGFDMTAQTDEGVNAFENPERNIYGVQFHPEVAHTPLGGQILSNF